LAVLAHGVCGSETHCGHSKTAEERGRRAGRGKETAKELAAQKEQEAKDHAAAFKDFPKISRN